MWDEKLDFVIDSLSDLFTITCFDEDNLTNDLVGSTQVSIPMLTAVEFNFDQWIVLYYQGKIAGNLKLSCSYAPP